jgi:phosphotransferase system enzyme I (PtsI)
MLSEGEQYTAYKEIARIAGQEGALVRLFDLGGENVAEPIQEPERNPALGLRAIRFCLRHESVMRTQLRALLRAAADGRIGIVLPMVADVGDVLRTKEILKQEETNLLREGERIGKVRTGAMIEVPSAVLTAEKIASHVDFFELGTNDLVQYTLAVDRGNDKVADWFRTLHPAVLHSIKRTLNAAREAGISAIICGEMASTPAYAVLLVGLGALELSMTPASIPHVRHALSSIDFRSARAIAEACLSCDTADEVEELVRQRFSANWPELFTSNSLPRPGSKA